MLIFLGEKLVGANFYAFCNYVIGSCILIFIASSGCFRQLLWQKHSTLGSIVDLAMFMSLMIFDHLFLAYLGSYLGKNTQLLGLLCIGNDYVVYDF